MRKLSQEEFLQKALFTHGVYYDYSKTEYLKGSCKIVIICPNHGEFIQSAADHLQGKGCRVCSQNNREDKWTAEQDSIIIENYSLKGRDFCMKILNRSDRAVRERARILQATRRQQKRLTHEYMNSIVWANLLKGAESRHLVVDIEFNDIWNLYLKQNKLCALTGWDVVYSQDFSEITASVDRIDSKLGYTHENIQIVHKLVNRIKSNLPEYDFYNLCKSIYLHKRDSYE